MIEIWRDVKDYKGYYQVSNLGRVKGLRSGKILKQRYNRFGYLRVNLLKEKSHKTHCVHRLGAIAFIPNPNNLPQVNHKDEDKTNNLIWINPDGSIDFEKSNLEWCDAEYNTNYGTRTERAKKGGIKRKKAVAMYKDNVLVKRYDSATDANRENENFNYVSISAACNGRLKTYKGYNWRFV